MSWTTGPLLAVDTETTGKDSNTARIVTADVARIEPGGQVTEPPGTVTLDEQMVYHHPDRGWVFAATGENCRTL